MTDHSDLPDLDPAALARYLSGEGSATDVAAIEAWVAADPRRAGEIEALRLAWASVAASPLPDALEASLARVLIRTGQAPSSIPHLVREPVSPGVAPRAPFASRLSGARVDDPAFWLSRPVWIGVAVAFVLAIGVTLGRPTSPRAGAMRDYGTARGQRLSVTLVDGTQFMLAPASRLRVPISFGHDGRSVALEGEAYFTVVHDAARPFVVHTRGAVVRDVGTTFDVRAYADDLAPRVAVAEGEVRVGSERCQADAGCDADLRANDLAIVSDIGMTVVHDADVRGIAGWTHGELTLRDAPLRQALADVSRWYGVDVQLADPSIGDRPIRATFTTEPLAVVLAAVTHAVGARYVQQGNRVTVLREGDAR